MDSSQAILSTASLAVVVFALCIGVAGSVWLLVRSSSYKLAPIACLLVGFLLEAIMKKQPYIQIGLQIYPMDLISLFVFFAFLAGFVSRPVPTSSRSFVLWLALGATLMYSLVVGLLENGKAAGNEARSFFYLWAAGLYCCAADFDEADLRRIGRWCIWTAYACLGIALWFWAGVEIGFLDRVEVLEFAAAGGVFRPVNSNVAFVVGAVALVQLMAWLRGTGTRLSGWHAATFLVFVIIMQHRSVWLATAVGLCCVLTLERQHLPRRFPLLLGFVLSSVLLSSILAWFGLLEDMGYALVQSTETISLHEGTLAGRIDGWERLLRPWWESSIETVLLGYPFGVGYARLANVEVIDYAPHSLYVELVLRVGLVGAVLFLWPTCAAVVGGLRQDCDSEFDYLLMRGLACGLIASLVYCTAYGAFYLVTAATGILLARLLVLQTRRRASLHRTTAGPIGHPWAERAAKR